MELFYNDVDITDEEGIDPETAEYDTYLGERADTLYLEFTDSESLWETWNPQTGDKIRIKEESLDSGNLIVNKIDFSNGMCKITAAAVADDLIEKKKEWSKGSFKAITKTLLDNMNLEAEYHGIKPAKLVYNLAKQENETDLLFLARRCRLEGCALIFTEKKGIIANIESLEKGEGGSYRLEGSIGNFRAYTSTRYGACTVGDGKISATAVINPELPGFTVIIKEELSSIEEARRFAKNFLLEKNRLAETGAFYNDSLLTEITAGTKFTADCGSWRDRLAIAKHVRHDLVKEKTKVEFYLLPEE